MCNLPATYDLPASKTHQHRRCHWVADKTGRTLGTLTVCQGQSTQEITTYEVSEGADPDGRLFLFKKVAERGRPLPDDERVVYAALINANGSDHRCICPGWAYGHGRRCRHIQAALTLLGDGALDPRPADPFPSPEQVADDAGKWLPPCFTGYGGNYPDCPF